MRAASTSNEILHALRLLQDASHDSIMETARRMERTERTWTALALRFTGAKFEEAQKALGDFR